MRNRAAKYAVRWCHLTHQVIAGASVHSREPKSRVAQVYPYFVSKRFINHSIIIGDFRGACAVKGNGAVAGHVKRVDHDDVFDALLFREETLTRHYFFKYIYMTLLQLKVE